MAPGGMGMRVHMPYTVKAVGRFPQAGVVLEQGVLSSERRLNQEPEERSPQFEYNIGLPSPAPDQQVPKVPEVEHVTRRMLCQVAWS